jgi:hypothetical protein
MSRTNSSDPFGTVHGAAPPELKAVCAELRRLVARLHGDFVEIVWPRQQIASFGVGPKKMSEHYAYIGVHRSHVNLGFYHGTSLPDPTCLLEGTGRKLRHVKIADLRSARDPAIAALLRAAIADRKRHAAPS